MQDEPKIHVNPPLTALNAASREADEANRGEPQDVGSVRNVQAQKDKRRLQGQTALRPITPPRRGPFE